MWVLAVFDLLFKTVFLRLNRILRVSQKSSTVSFKQSVNQYALSNMEHICWCKEYSCFETLEPVCHMLRNKRNLKIQEFKTEYSFHQPPSQIMNGKVCSLIVPFPEFLLDLIITRDLPVNTVDNLCTIARRIQSFYSCTLFKFKRLSP